MPDAAMFRFLTISECRHLQVKRKPLSSLFTYPVPHCYCVEVNILVEDNVIIFYYYTLTTNNKIVE